MSFILASILLHYMKGQRIELACVKALAVVKIHFLACILA